jgi:hypothetical protein
VRWHYRYAVGPFSAVMLELTRLRIGIRSEACSPIRLRVFQQPLDVAQVNVIPHPGYMAN